MKDQIEQIHLCVRIRVSFFAQDDDDALIKTHIKAKLHFVVYLAPSV